MITEAKKHKPKKKKRVYSLLLTSKVDNSNRLCTLVGEDLEQVWVQARKDLAKGKETNNPTSYMLQLASHLDVDMPPGKTEFVSDKKEKPNENQIEDLMTYVRDTFATKRDKSAFDRTMKRMQKLAIPEK